MDRKFVRLDPKKLNYLRLKRNLTVEALCVEAQQAMAVDDKRTVRKIIDGQPVYLKSAIALANLLGAEDLISVLHPDLLAELGPPSGWGAPQEFFSTVGEWETLEPLGPIEQTANGLRYDVWKMRHRYVNGRLGRGKCYDLNQLSTQERSRLKEHLTRHSQVCDRIGPHPNVITNRSVTPWEHGAYWWVVDEWVDGDSLDCLLNQDRLAASQTPAVLRDIARGLQALHAAGIIRRELAPRHVLVRKGDGIAMLIDFELAKLSDGVPTVAPAGEWPDDAYRAIEVDAHADLDPRADIYSWGRIAVHAICGELPERGGEADALAAVTVPDSVRAIVLAAVAVPRSDRPATTSQIVEAIRKWN
jgi:serine/threonine protein kinase